MNDLTTTSEPVKQEQPGREYRWWDDSEKFVKIEQAISIGSTLEMAWYFAGITPTQWYYYIGKINPDYKVKIEILEQAMPLKAANEVYKGLENNPEFSLKVLERVSKKKFAPRTELTGPEGNPVMEKMDSKSLDERINAILDQLKGLNGGSSTGSTGGGTGTVNGTA